MRTQTHACTTWAWQEREKWQEQAGIRILHVRRHAAVSRNVSCAFCCCSQVPFSQCRGSLLSHYPDVMFPLCKGIRYCQVLLLDLPGWACDFGLLLIWYINNRIYRGASGSLCPTVHVLDAQNQRLLWSHTTDIATHMSPPGTAQEIYVWLWFILWLLHLVFETFYCQFFFQPSHSVAPYGVVSYSLRSWVSPRWTYKMVQWVKTIATKSDNMSLIPGIYIVGGDNQLLKAVFWPPHTYLGTHVLIYIDTHTDTKTNKFNNNKKKLIIKPVGFQIVNKLSLHSWDKFHLVVLNDPFIWYCVLWWIFDQYS